MALLMSLGVVVAVFAVGFRLVVPLTRLPGGSAPTGEDRNPLRARLGLASSGALPGI